jgi:hypothetical protein
VLEGDGISASTLTTHGPTDSAAFRTKLFRFALDFLCPPLRIFLLKTNASSVEFPPLDSRTEEDPACCFSRAEAGNAPPIVHHAPIATTIPKALVVVLVVVASARKRGQRFHSDLFLQSAVALKSGLKGTTTNCFCKPARFWFVSFPLTSFTSSSSSTTNDEDAEKWAARVLLREQPKNARRKRRKRRTRQSGNTGVVGDRTKSTTLFATGGGGGTKGDIITDATM